MMESKRVRFRVSGKITKLLGRESVSESITALFEILKNSHDADALSATVEFKDIISNAGKITMKENKGDGMTYDDIVNKFFLIGTYFKEAKGDDDVRETQRLHRKMLGSKGVGRFALERLGHQVKIISCPINTSDKYTFVIDWDKFEPREVTVDQIGIEIIHEKNEDREKSGLEIEISRLRDEWDAVTLNELETKLQRLILPQEFQTENAFNIVLDAPEFGYNKKLISVKLLKRSYYYLKAELFEDRIKVSAKIEDKPVISSKFGNDIITEFLPFQPGAKLTESAKKTGYRNVKDLSCGHAKLYVYYFPVFQRNSPENRRVRRWYGEVFSTLVDTELEKHSGVRIYRDGMREFSYGDPKNDWVDRASISRNLSGTIQAERLLGYLLITNKENKQIRSTTNRLTAIQNPAFLDLREFVIQSMLHFDHYLNRRRREEVEKRTNLKMDKEALTQLEVFKEKFTNSKSKIRRALTKVRDLTGEDLSPEVENLLDTIDNVKGRIEEKIKETEKEMTENQIERSLASLGNIVSMMIHEINDAVTISYRESDKLRKYSLGNTKLTEKEINQTYFDLFNRISKIRDWNDFVNRFSSNLTLEDLYSRREDVIHPNDVAKKFIQDVKNILSIPYITIENNIDKKLKIKMFSAYFDSIIGNLMSNSIKSINSLENKETQENKITVSTENSGKDLIIYFSDNGVGIDKKRWESIFEPHISSTSKDLLFKGHGLGLPIVRSMVNEYDGEISVVEPIYSQGTTFKIKIPWKEIDPEK